MTLPDSYFIPAPLWLITALQIFTLSLHFIAMNFLFGGILVVLQAGSKDRWNNPVVRRLVRMFPSAMAVTVTLGVAPLLFLQVVFPGQMYSAAIVSGWLWLGVVGAVTTAYFALHRAALKCNETAEIRRVPLAVALLGMLYVSLIYSSVFSMAERPGLIHSLYARSQTGLMLNPALGDYLMRWLHMMLGAATVGGYFVGLLGKDHPEAYAMGKKFFLWGMVLASGAGIGYMGSLTPYMAAFMHSPGIWALTLAVVLSLGSMHFFFKKKFLPSGLMLFVSLMGMVTARHYVRLVKLQGQFDPSTWRVSPQWSPFVLFLVCLVIALAAVYYMLRLFLGAKAPAA